jgi:hypothetical protein
MGIDLLNGCLCHEVAVQVAAASASDPGVVAGIDVVHGHLEGLHLLAFAAKGREQAGYDGGLAAGASIASYKDSWTVGSHFIIPWRAL